MVLVLVAGLQVVQLVGLGEVRAQLRESEDQIRAQQRELDLLRIETGTEGLGIHAVIEHIETLMPELVNSSTPKPQRTKVEDLLHRALDATESLGPDVFPVLAAAIDETDRDVKTREWLMKAALRADRSRGLELLSDYTRGRRGGGNGRLRILAGKTLLAEDPRLAGEAMHEVLTTESHLGVRRARGSNGAVEAMRPPVRDFFNFITLYAQSDHPDVEVTLLSLLDRRDHNLITKQTCITHLGGMRSQRAAEKIRQLFADPGSMEPSPLFRQRCVQAIGLIEGANACDWYREQLKTASSPPVRAALQAQLREYCN